MSKAKEFATKGPIADPGEQIYIERPEDTEILQAVRRGDYVTLLGARQTGKTSLLYKLARELKIEIPVFVNLPAFSGVREDDWYDCVAKMVVKHLPQELRDAIGEENSCADQYQFRNLLWEVADALVGTDIVLFLLNEIGIVLEEIRDDFFGTIRAIYEERGVEEAFQKLIFVLSGTTPPAELITSQETSPFNISQIIYMSDFSLEGVMELGENLRLHGFAIADSVIEHIYEWTRGHPNLTQEIFARLIQSKSEKVTEKMVDDLVDELVAKGCNNLNHILRHVQDESVNQQVFGILNRELEIPFNLSNPKILNLYLIGVIGEGTEGECVIRNKIYAKALPSIREEKESQIDKQVERSPLTANIISNLRIYVPLRAISLIDPESITIGRIQGVKFMKRITFKDKNRDRGLDTIVRSGTVVWTDESGVYLVDEEYIQALEKNQIPYLRIKSHRTSERKSEN